MVKRGFSHSALLALLLVTYSLADLIVTGAPGEKGETGELGPPGPEGAQGPTGEAGAPGDTGSKGENGIKGDLGIVGTNGLKGQPGSTGLNGSSGLPGNTGSPGPTGIQGATGATGDVGVTGETGMAGKSGQTGMSGLRAGAGQKGQKGSVGDTGERGNQGEVGFTGQKGAPGVKGPKGTADVNECLTSPCPASAVGCENTALGFVCTCQDGYAYNQISNICEDVNECLVLYGNCDSACIDEPPGSYTCACITEGFMLSPLDKHSCIDINECDEPSICTQDGMVTVCVNTYGSYLCVDVTPIADAGSAAAQTGVIAEDLANKSMVIVLVVWAAFLTLLFIIIIIILILKRQNYITEQKQISKFIDKSAT